MLSRFRKVDIITPIALRPQRRQHDFTKIPMWNDKTMTKRSELDPSLSWILVQSTIYSSAISNHWKMYAMENLFLFICFIIVLIYFWWCGMCAILWEQALVYIHHNQAKYSIAAKFLSLSLPPSLFHPIEQYICFPTCLYVVFQLFTNKIMGTHSSVEIRPCWPLTVVVQTLCMETCKTCWHPSLKICTWD